MAEAIDRANALWELRLEHHAIELWKGPKKVFAVSRGHKGV
jgi:hypothetical protein